MIPSQFTLADMQDSFRDIYQKLDSLLVRNVDFSGRRIVNAGRALDDFDYVRKMELEQGLAALTQNTSRSIKGLLNSAQTVRFGGFSTRGSPTAHERELFMASDLDYIGWLSTGTAWIYVYGTRAIAQSAISTFTGNLGTNDAGCLINVTDYTHLLRWTGSATEFAPGDSGSGYIEFFPITPPGGTWGLCDGSSYNYLKADGTTASFTTPDYSTAAYIKAGTSATIGPTAASGTVASESSHTHAIDPPSTTSGNNSASQEVQMGIGTTVAANTHTHDTDIASFTSGAGSSHNHGPGTLELRRSQLIGYFRR